MDPYFGGWSSRHHQGKCYNRLIRFLWLFVYYFKSCSGYTWCSGTDTCLACLLYIVRPCIVRSLLSFHSTATQQLLSRRCRIRRTHGMKKEQRRIKVKPLTNLSLEQFGESCLLAFCTSRNSCVYCRHEDESWMLQRRQQRMHGYGA